MKKQEKTTSTITAGHVKKGIFVFLLAAAANQALFSASSFAGPSGPRLAIGGIAGWTSAREGSSNSMQASGLSTSRKLSGGAGLLLEAPLVDASFGLEVGALYVARKFEIGNDTLKLTRTVPTIFIPIEARFWFGDFFSAAAGGFGAIRVGDETNELKAGGTTLSGSFSSNNREGMEYGLTVAADVNVAMINKTGVFVEGRYNRGFTNSAKDGVFEEKIDDFLLMAGIRIDI